MNRVALCVGGTAGIGRALARKLAKEKISVVVMGRNKDAGEKVLEDLKYDFPEGNHKFMECDAFLMKNIRQSCEELKNKLDQINYCVFTQGMVSLQKRKETVEEIDQKLALHYFGRVQFIEELLPLLNKGSNTGHGRVMSVLSAGEHQPYLHSGDLSLRINYTVSDVANATGFYTDLAFHHYSIAHPNLSFIHINPGNVNTNWGAKLPFMQRALANMIQFTGISPEKCAENISAPLLSPHLPCGFYLIGKNSENAPTTSAHGEIWRNAVMKHTMEVLDETRKQKSV